MGKQIPQNRLSLLQLGTSACIEMPHRIQRTIVLFVWIVISISSAAAATDGADLRQLVQEVVNNEIQSQTSEANDNLLWSYRKLTHKENKELLWEYCETKQGIINRLVAINGKPLSRSQQLKEEQRIQNLVTSPAAVKEEQNQEKKDGREERKFITLLPKVFRYQEAQRQDDILTLSFTPDPAFHPSGNEERVIHALQGNLVLDLQHKRLVGIRGRLISEVKFLGGIAGHLAAGGTFSVETISMAPNDRELKRLDIDMKGKALLFKTISVQEHDVYSQYTQVPPGTTLAEAADRLKKDSGT
jgi:hypothetical protein